jgi:hypothetical protein
MMTSDDLREWAMAQPRPALIKVEVRDGAVHEVVCQGPWTKVGDTLFALQGELLHAMTSDRQILRTIRPNDHSADWSEGRPPAPQGGPEVIPVPTADPETQRLVVVANLIANAYRHATDVAFSQLVQLVEASSARSEAVERARDQLHRAQIRQLEEQLRAHGAEPTESGDLMQQMVASWMAGAAQTAPPADASPAPPTKTANGKGH